MFIENKKLEGGIDHEWTTIDKSGDGKMGNKAIYSSN